jgi:hypothetical protein
VAGDDGRLAVIGGDGAVRILAVTRAALHRPVLDVARRRVVVVAGDGELVALEVPGWI